MPPGHVLHDEEVHAVLGVEVEDGRDARVREAGQDVRLAPEALARGRVPERAAQKHLDRDVAVEVQVAGAIDLAHAACAERFQDLVVGELLSDHRRTTVAGVTRLP